MLRCQFEVNYEAIITYLWRLKSTSHTHVKHIPPRSSTNNKCPAPVSLPLPIRRTQLSPVHAKDFPTCAGIRLISFVITRPNPCLLSAERFLIDYLCVSFEKNKIVFCVPFIKSQIDDKICVTKLI